MVCLNGLRVVVATALLLLLAPSHVTARGSSRNVNSYHHSVSEYGDVLRPRDDYTKKLLLRRELYSIIDELNAGRASKVAPRSVYEDVYERSDELNARGLNPLLTALYDELVIREPRDHSPDMSIGPNDKQKSLGKRLSIKDFGNANQPPGSSQPAGPKDQVPSSTPDPSKTHIRKKGSMMSLQSMFKPAGQKQPQAANAPGPQPNRANENGKRRISLVNDTKSKAKRLKNSGKKFFNRIETAAKGARRCIRDKYNRLVCPRPTNVSPMNAAFENSARPDDSQLVPPPPLLGESGRTQSEESFYNKMQPLERMGGRHEVPTYHNEGASSPTDHFNHPATGTNPGNAANSPAGMRSPGDAASSSARVHDSSAVDRPQSYASVLGSDGGYSSGDSDEDSEGPPTPKEGVSLKTFAR